MLYDSVESQVNLLPRVPGRIIPRPLNCYGLTGIVERAESLWAELTWALHSHRETRIGICSCMPATVIKSLWPAMRDQLHPSKNHSMTVTGSLPHCHSCPSFVKISLPESTPDPIDHRLLQPPKKKEKNATIRLMICPLCAAPTSDANIQTKGGGFGWQPGRP
jgi:hypothetical protein